MTDFQTDDARLAEMHGDEVANGKRSAHDTAVMVSAMSSLAFAYGVSR